MAPSSHVSPYGVGASFAVAHFEHSPPLSTPSNVAMRSLSSNLYINRILFQGLGPLILNMGLGLHRATRRLGLGLPGIGECLIFDRSKDMLRNPIGLGLGLNQVVGCSM
jgi:hypothetical protein